MSSDASLPPDDVAIRVRNLQKHYLIFDRPEDRLKQMVMPRLQRLASRPAKRYYRDFAALTDVSFDIGRGETVGIVGRNGSGKSTLLQIICGTLQPSGGTVEVKGRIAALLELGAGFNPEFTGRENVFLNAAILGMTRAEIDARFDAIAAFADIGEFLHQPVKTYSSGMFVRLAFATAINTDPDILVVDEALAVGDEAFQRKCFARIEQIKNAGATILFVSHGAQAIVQLCDRAILLDHGEKLMEGRPKHVTSQYQRLANSSFDAANEIRANLRHMRDMPPVDDVVRPDSQAEDRQLAEEKGGEGAEVSRQKAEQTVEIFDSALKSESSIHLEERGAKIRDVRILNVSGEPVNVLQLGKRYVVEYFVDFTEAAADVGFGFFIRNIKGIGLAGAQTVKSRVQRTARVQDHYTAEVSFEFSCALVPSTYFVTCGVFGTVGGEQIVMHRIIDATAFKVAPEQDLIALGSFDLNSLPQVQFSETLQTASVESPAVSRAVNPAKVYDGASK